jgi:hypothetical protein
MVKVLKYIVILMKMTQCYILPLQLSQLTSFFTTPTLRSHSFVLKIHLLLQHLGPRYVIILFYCDIQ